MVGTWLGEIRSCSILAVLPDSAWVLLNKIYQPFFTSLYFLYFDLISSVYVELELRPARTMVVYAQRQRRKGARPEERHANAKEYHANNKRIIEQTTTQSTYATGVSRLSDSPS